MESKPLQMDSELEDLPRSFRYKIEVMIHDGSVPEVLSI